MSTRGAGGQGLSLWVPIRVSFCPRGRAAVRSLVRGAGRGASWPQAGQRQAQSGVLSRGVHVGPRSAWGQQARGGGRLWWHGSPTALDSLGLPSL